MKHATMSSVPMGARDVPVIAGEYQAKAQWSSLLIGRSGGIWSKSPIHVQLPLLAAARRSYIGAMAKPKSRYVCQACGSVSSRWQGQCSDCAEWNTLIQEAPDVSSIFAARHDLQGGGRVIPLIGLDAPAVLPERFPSGV